MKVENVMKVRSVEFFISNILPPTSKVKNIIESLMKKSILYLTGNQEKVIFAQSICNKYDIEVVSQKMDLEEIQDSDFIKIAVKKANDAFVLIKKPLVISDAAWSIPALKGFPGAYMKFVNSWFTAQDFLNLMIDKSDRSITLKESLIYIDESGVKIFSTEHTGKFLTEPKGNGSALNQVVTFGKLGLSISEAFEQKVEVLGKEENFWDQFCKWYTEN